MESLLKEVRILKEIEEQRLKPDPKNSGTRASNLTHTGQDISSFQSFFGRASLKYPTIDDGYRFQWLTEKGLETVDAELLYKRIIKYAPPVKRAYNKWLSSTITKWDLRGTTAAMDAYIENALNIQNQRGEPFDTVLEQLAELGFYSGALFAEMILDSRTREFLRFDITNPFRARFRPVEDPELGYYYELGIKDVNSQDGFRSLDGIPTVLYQILNPAIDEPYSDPFIDAAVFPIIIYMGMLMDIRKMIRGQAQPKRFIGWDLRPFANLEWTGDEISQFIDAEMKKMISKLASSNPEDDFILPGGATLVNDPGRMGANLAGVDTIRQICIQLLAQALNVPSAVLSSNEGTTESFASFTWRDYYKDRSATQEKFESFISILFTRAARAIGIRGEAIFRLERNDELEQERKSEIRKKESEAKNLYLDGIEKEINLGLLTAEEAREQYLEKLEEEEEKGKIIDLGSRSNRILSRKMEKVKTLSHSRLQTRQTEEHVEPDLSGGRLLPIQPLEIRDIDDSVIDTAISTFDRALPQLEGLLEAGVDEKDEDSNWIFDTSTFDYLNTETDRRLTEDERDSESDVLTDFLILGAIATSLRVAKKEITLNNWVGDMREDILVSRTTQYLFSKGGVNNLDGADRSVIAFQTNQQYNFLQNFATDLRDGRLTESQLLNRARMYIEASTASYERGKTATRTQLILPEYPADGSQDCISNCRCHWKITETETHYVCYWNLDPRADHCNSCIDNASKWSPYTQLKINLAG